MELPDVVEEELRCTLGRDDGVGCHEMCLLCCEVDDVHDHVVTVGIREFADEVDAHNVPRHVRNGHQVQFAVWFVSRRLHVTAQITSLRVQTNLPAEARPPVAPRNQFEGFESPRMPCDARVVVLLDDSLSKILIFQDIDLAMKEKDMVFKGPFCTLN